MVKLFFKTVWCMALIIFAIVAFCVTGSAQKITLKWWHWAQWQNPMWEEIIDRYEELHPEVEINQKIIPWVHWMGSLTASQMAGDAPDLYMMHIGAEMIKHVEHGQLVDLSPYMDEEWRSAFYPSLWQLMKVGEKVTFNPFVSNNCQFWYKKPVFEKYGFKIPKTLDELQQIANKLNAEGLIPVSYMMNINPWVYDFFDGVVGGWCPDLWNRVNFLGEDIWDRPEFRQVFENFDKYFIKGKILIEGSVGLDHLMATTAFVKGDAAMYYDGNWHTTTIREMDPEGFKDIGIFPFPAGKPWIRPPVPVGPAVGAGVWSGSPHIKEATEFVRWVTFNGQRKIMTTIGICPAGPLFTEQELREVGEEAKNHLYLDWVRGQEGESGYPIVREFFNPKVEQAVLVGVQKLVTQKATPTEVWQDVIKASRE